jgi:hypothetical protein
MLFLSSITVVLLVLCGLGRINWMWFWVSLGILVVGALFTL